MDEVLKIALVEPLTSSIPAAAPDAIIGDQPSISH
jgi:hypothetical protein